MTTTEETKSTDNKIADNISHVKHSIVVFSGKGGVGKTTVSVNIAYGLQLNGNKTGILDADITGPNVPKMTGIKGDVNTNNGKIIPQISRGVKVISMANLLPPNQAIVWRGPMRSKMINEFLGNAEWGNLDYLIADLPPGTGDEIITMVQNMRPDMAIIVTTPQDVSLIDSARSISMAKKMKIPKIALIENMSGFVCPECGHRIDLFSSGGGKKQANDMDINFLGTIPINLEARKLADNGESILHKNKKADMSVELYKIVDKIERSFENKS